MLGRSLSNAIRRPVKRIITFMGRSRIRFQVIEPALLAPTGLTAIAS